MAWQEIAALSIVGVTAGVFAWRMVRPRSVMSKSRFACSCAGASPSSMPNMVFKARKGERAQILVKAPSQRQPLAHARGSAVVEGKGA
jgi:hypothetical protein